MLSLHAFSGRSLCERSARLRPLSQTPKSTSPASEESRVTSRPRHAARPKDDAGIRTRVTCGPTDYRPAASRSKGEVVALCIGNYCFAEVVYEITLHPRPASRGFASTVETDQPRELLIEVNRCHTVELSPGACAPEPYRIQRMPPERHSPACQTRKIGHIPGLWACTSTAKTTASKSRCTVTT